MNYGKSSIEKTKKELASRSRKRSRKIALSVVQLLLISLGAAAVMVLAIGVGAFRAIIDTAPDIGNIDVTPSGFSTFVYDSEGNQTAKLVSTDSNRIPVTMDMVPKDLCNAFVAIEDERFYEHRGVDIQGILRAGVKGLTSGNFSEGASTITQQLLKNNVFTSWTSETFAESVRRKIQEQYLAIELEKKMSKADILLNYMNTINLGHSTLGIQAASLRYFGKSVSELSLSESAVIAGITQNPTRYDPIVYPEKNAERRAMVLGSMLKLGFITDEEYRKASDDNVYDRIQIVDVETDDTEVNSYFVDALTNQILEDLMAAGYTETQAYTLLYSGGLNIYSTQDPAIQAICDEVTSNPENYPEGTRYLMSYQLTVRSADGEITNYSSEMFEDWLRQNNISRSLLFPDESSADEAAAQFREAVVGDGEVQGESRSLTPQPQISLTIEDQHTGAVVAMVGGRGAKLANRTLNRATDTMRQPGSTFKVVSTYAPALDSAGMTLATTQDDAPFSYDNGTPVRNWYGEAYRGLSSLRVGIQNSMNIVAVKTLKEITPQLGIDYLKNLGITTLVEGETINGVYYSDNNLSLSLGGITNGVKNIELNGAYATIANGGIYIKPKLYIKITDHDGKVILDNTEGETRRVLKETTAWLLTSAMEDVVTKGTGTRVNFGTTAIAGKTGTTSDYNDVWFCGYTDYYTASCWAGFDDNTKLSSSTEKALAQTIWKNCMAQIHAELPARQFAMPEGIVRQTICTASGLLPVAGLCDATLGQEYFDKDTLPTQTCNIHYQGMICEYSGLPAADGCPFAVQGVLSVPPESVGQRCEHTAAFMATPEGQATAAQQQQELSQRHLAASIGDANARLQAAADALAQAQSALVAAQQGGDAAAISAAQQQVQTAAEAYNAAAAVQAAAAAAAAASGGSAVPGQ
ncbi:transglycosylase domain-containing protein [Lachnoclostridium sp. Marseille-P6806]|uniref:transglycosylase domain-containing protein n=1 Tax=Lachnoclostridium sp. Marseille-P6806 TaxID=2364793 RepID=UPI00102FF536|nr:transglycosylase domain-containing protein [Lachnoclostridium sp. Marseille-P6806]